MLQILASEYSSLTAMRSQGQAEAASRAGMFVAALSGGIVAVSFIAQATRFGPESVAFALLILPVVLFIGLTTFVRTLDISADEVRWVSALNHVRSGYITVEPLAKRYLTLHREDQAAAILATMNPGRTMSSLYGIVTTPGLVSVINSILAGSVAGLITSVVAPEIGVPVIAFVGTAAFVLVLTLQAVYGGGVFGRAMREVASNLDARPSS